jgi:hypothetical protein
MNLQAGILSGTPPARALPPCLESTTAPVRHFFQDVNYGSTEMGCMMPASINVGSLWNVKVQTSGEVIHADVSAHIRYNGLDDKANLYLPMPSGVGDPTGAYCHPSECWVPPPVSAAPNSLPRSPSSSATTTQRLPNVQERPREYDDTPAVQQQPYRQSPSYRDYPVYPPLPPEPTQVLPSPQPDRNSRCRVVNLKSCIRDGSTHLCTDATSPREAAGSK